jgi:hypothetical protein
MSSTIPFPHANGLVIGTVVTPTTPGSSKTGETVPRKSHGLGSFAQEVTVWCERLSAMWAVEYAGPRYNQGNGKGQRRIEFS